MTEAESWRQNFQYFFSVSFDQTSQPLWFYRLLSLKYLILSGAYTYTVMQIIYSWLVGLMVKIIF